MWIVGVQKTKMSIWQIKIMNRKKLKTEPALPIGLPAQSRDRIYYSANKRPEVSLQLGRRRPYMQWLHVGSRR
jgi:hypothetical protein